MLLSVCLLTLFSGVCVWGREHAPVLIWGQYGSAEQVAAAPVPALGQLRAFQFGQLLHHLATARPHVLLFTEHNLSVEDFSWRDEHETCVFPNLRNLSQSSPGFLYLPSVEAPVSVLHQMTHHGYSFSHYDETSPPVLSVPTILTASLREPGPDEPRQAFLHAHDVDMARVSEDVIRRYGKVLVLYTGRHASFVAPARRHKREVEEEQLTANEIVMTDSEKKIFVVTAAPIIYRKGDVVTNLTQVTYASTETNKKPYIALDVKFKEEAISLDLVFNSPTERQAWTLEMVKVEQANVEMRSRTQMGAPAGYSYFCAQDITFTGTGQDGVKYSLTLKGIQAQPRVTNNAFGPAADCVPYFSEPIWTGLLVMLLLITVAFMAILFILDIRTMDKFDDPKGKVITITNAE